MIRITATVSLWSKSMKGDQMSAMIGIEADSTTRKGSERDPPRPRPDSYGWHLSHSVNGENPMVEDAIGPLSERLRAFPKLLEPLRASDPDLRVKFSIAIVPTASDDELSVDYKVAMFIGRDIIGLLAELEAEFDFEVYKFPN